MAMKGAMKGKMMKVTQKAAVKIAELLKNDGEKEKHVRLNLDSVT